MSKVLQIPNYQYPHIGGIEQVSRDIARVLNTEEIEQKIICFNEDAQDEEYICRRRETTHDMVDGVEVIRCGCFAKVASQSLSLTYFGELRRVMDDFKPDIVVFHYPNPFAAFLLMRYKKRDFKLLLYWHLDITKQKLLRKIFHKQNLALIKRADYILGATPKHLNESKYSSYFGTKKKILPYMINEENLQLSPDEIKNAEQLHEKYPGKVLCFFIGRHVPYKGLKYLIEASKILGNKNIQFLIGGSGELTDELKRQASGDEKIEFVGRLNDSEKRIYLYACDIFCFPSVTRNEAFGLALAEAMYFGKPAITFTIPGSGVNYVNLNEVTGIECPNSDAKAYAKAIRMLVDNPQMREKYGKNGRSRVIEYFLFDRFKRNVQELIN